MSHEAVGCICCRLSRAVDEKRQQHLLVVPTFMGSPSLSLNACSKRNKWLGLGGVRRCFLLLLSLRRPHSLSKTHFFALLLTPGGWGDG